MTTYGDAIRELLRRVEADEPIMLIDDDSLGNKSTSCHWGMCAAGFTDVRKRAQRNCPFDKAKEYNAYGCFWRCKLFKGRSGYARRQHTAEEAKMASEILTKVLNDGGD